MHMRVDDEFLPAMLSLLRLQAGLPDHGGPHLDVGFQPRLEFLRRAGLGLAAELEHALLEVGALDDGADVAVEHVTIAFGVPAGATSEFQPTTSASMPLSFSVGTSGCIGERLSPVAAMAPDLSAVDRRFQRGVGFDADLRVAAQQRGEHLAVLRCGTMVTGMPVAARNSSAVTFCVLPGLMVPMLNLPGSPRASPARP